jgi:hypothetical protein
MSQSESDLKVLKLFLLNKHEKDGMTWAEIADKLDVTASTLKEFRDDPKEGKVATNAAKLMSRANGSFLKGTPQEPDARTAFKERVKDEATALEHRLGAMGFDQPHLNDRIIAALAAGKISAETAAKWHQIRLNDNCVKHCVWGCTESAKCKNCKGKQCGSKIVWPKDI